MSILISKNKVISDFQTAKYIFKNSRGEKNDVINKFFIRCDMNPIYLPLQSNILLNTGLDIFCNDPVSPDEELIGLDTEFDSVWKESSPVEKDLVRKFINSNLKSDSIFFTTIRVRKYRDFLYYIEKTQESNTRIIIKFDSSHMKNYFENKYRKLPIINLPAINNQKPIFIIPNVWEYEKNNINSPLNKFIRNLDFSNKDMDISYDFLIPLLNFSMYIPALPDRMILHLLWPLFSNPTALLERLATESNLVTYFFIEKEIYLKAEKKKVSFYITDDGFVGRDSENFKTVENLVESGECICSRCYIKNDTNVFNDMIIYCLFRIKMRDEDADRNAKDLIDEEEMEKEKSNRKKILKALRKKKKDALSRNKNLAKKIANEALIYYDKMMKEKAKQVTILQKKKILAKLCAEEAKEFIRNKVLRPVHSGYSSETESISSEKSTPLLNHNVEEENNKEDIWLFNLWN